MSEKYEERLGSDLFEAENKIEDLESQLADAKKEAYYWRMRCGDAEMFDRLSHMRKVSSGFFYRAALDGGKA